MEKYTRKYINMQRPIIFILSFPIKENVVFRFTGQVFLNLLAKNSAYTDKVKEVPQHKLAFVYKINTTFQLSGFTIINYYVLNCWSTKVSQWQYHLPILSTHVITIMLYVLLSLRRIMLHIGVDERWCTTANCINMAHF